MVSNTSGAERNTKDEKQVATTISIGFNSEVEVGKRYRHDGTVDCTYCKMTVPRQVTAEMTRSMQKVVQNLADDDDNEYPRRAVEDRR